VKRFAWYVVAIVIIGLAGAITWFGMPRLVSVSPANESLDIPAGAGLRLEFSRSMLAESVKEHLSIEPALPGSIVWQGNILIYTPDRPWAAGTVVQVKLESGSLPASFPALPIRQESSWSFTIRQPHLLYLYPAEGPANIYLYDPRTGQSVRLTDEPLGVYEFDVNSSGTVIYYSARNDQGGSDIDRLEIGAGSKASNRLTLLECQKTQCRAPLISDQEDFLAIERTAPPGSGHPDFQQVWYMPVELTQSPDGGLQPGPLQPVLAGDAAHNTYQPAWSPLGILNFYDFDQQAFIFLDPKTGEQAQFPNRAGEVGSWDPTGQYFVAPDLVAQTNGGSSGNGQDLLLRQRLVRYDWKAKNSLELTLGEDVDDAWPAYSPDGTFLAFARRYLDLARWSPGRQIWFMRNDGSDALALTDEPDYNHYNLSWSPAEDRLAFVRFNRTDLVEQPELWLISLDNRQSIRLVTGGYAPHWIP
jgi:Tol biopolymer transport system component